MGSSRLIRIDMSYGSALVTCQCGFRSLRLTRESAQLAADRHRAQVHPKQAQSLAYKRKLRAVTP